MFLRRVFSSKGGEVETAFLDQIHEEDAMQQLQQNQKRMQDEIKGMKQDFEDGLAVHAAFQNGRSASNLDQMALPGTNGVDYQLSGGPVSAALGRNLAALDNLGPGELVKRLDLLQGAVETLLTRLAPSALKERTAMEPAVVAKATFPSMPATVCPPLPPPASPPPPEDRPPDKANEVLGKVAMLKEQRAQEIKTLAPRDQPKPESNGGMPTVTEVKEENKRWDVNLTRDQGQTSWGLQWDRRAFNEKRRIVEAVVPDTPAGLWNKANENSDNKLQKGDELLALNGNTGWLACSELSRLQQVQLTFQRAADGKRKVIRFEASGSPARPTPEESKPVAVAAGSEKVETPFAPTETPVKGSDGGDTVSTLAVLEDALQRSSVPATVPAAPPPREERPSPVRSMPGKLQQVKESAVPDLAATTQSPRTSEQQRQEQVIRKQRMEQQKAYLKRISTGEQAKQSLTPAEAANQLAQVSSEQPTEVGLQDFTKPTLTKPSADDLTKLATLLAQGEAGSALQLVQPLLRKQVKKGENGEAEFTTVDTKEAAKFLLEVMEVMEASSQVGPAAAPLLT